MYQSYLGHGFAFLKRGTLEFPCLYVPDGRDFARIASKSDLALFVGKVIVGGIRLVVEVNPLQKTLVLDNHDRVANDPGDDYRT